MHPKPPPKMRRNHLLLRRWLPSSRTTTRAARASTRASTRGRAATDPTTMPRAAAARASRGARLCGLSATRRNSASNTACGCTRICKTREPSSFASWSRRPTRRFRPPRQRRRRRRRPPPPKVLLELPKTRSRSRPLPPLRSASGHRRRVDPRASLRPRRSSRTERKKLSLPRRRCWLMRRPRPRLRRPLRPRSRRRRRSTRLVQADRSTRSRTSTCPVSRTTRFSSSSVS